MTGPNLVARTIRPTHTHRKATETCTDSCASQTRSDRITETSLMSVRVWWCSPGNDKIQILNIRRCTTIAASGNDVLSTGLSLPMLKELIPEGVDYGSNLLVEFEPRSIWFEASLTLAAQAVKEGVKTEYHTFQMGPKEIRKALARMGVNAEAAHANGDFDIIDSHTIQSGIGVPETLDQVVSQSVKLSDWSIGFVKLLKAGIQQQNLRWLHVDDNTGVLLEYNQEKDFIDLWRTRVIPYIRQCESVLLYSVAKGVASDAFYKKVESLCDGIIDFKSEEEKESAPGQFVRVSLMRGRTVDSRWRRLQLQGNGEVTLVH